MNNITENTESESIQLRPLIDAFETEAAITIIANIPGVEKENLSISIDDHILTLHGEYISDRKYKRESHKAKFCYDRQFKIGESINSEEIIASIKDGIATIILSKAKKSEPKRIAIKVN